LITGKVFMKRRYQKGNRKVITTYLGEEARDMIRLKIIKLLLEDVERGRSSYGGGNKQNRDICKREQG
jgi:hypothetical protein